MKKKYLPLGYDDFRELREADRYFADKTMMIEEFLEYGDKVALITRPRRFGKTLNMTMLREFLDITAVIFSMDLQLWIRSTLDRSILSR